MNAILDNIRDRELPIAKQNKLASHYIDPITHQALSEEAYRLKQKLRDEGDSA